MILNNKLKTIFVLALYIGFTIAIYAIVCHFLKIEFQDIHLLYAVLVGCIAYLPKFIAEEKEVGSLSFPAPDAPVRGQSLPSASSRSHVPPSRDGGGSVLLQREK